MSSGHIAPSGYKMTGQTNRATETTSNDGLGNPVKHTGMIRSTFRPSDGQCFAKFLIWKRRDDLELTASRRNYSSIPDPFKYDVCPLPRSRILNHIQPILPNLTHLPTHPQFKHSYAKNGSRYPHCRHKTCYNLPPALWLHLRLRSRRLWLPNPNGRCKPPLPPLLTPDKLYLSPRRSLSEHTPICAQ